MVLTRAPTRFAVLRCVESTFFVAASVSDLFVSSDGTLLHTLQYGLHCLARAGKMGIHSLMHEVTAAGRDLFDALEKRFLVFFPIHDG